MSNWKETGYQSEPGRGKGNGEGEKGDERGKKELFGSRGGCRSLRLYLVGHQEHNIWSPATHELPFFVHRYNSTSLPVNRNQSTTPCFDYSRSCLLLLSPFRLHPLALYSEAKPGLSSCTTMLTSFGSRTHRDQVSPGSWNLSRCGRKI